MGNVIEREMDIKFISVEEHSGIYKDIKIYYKGKEVSSEIVGIELYYDIKNPSGFAKLVLDYIDMSDKKKIEKVKQELSKTRDDPDEIKVQDKPVYSDTGFIDKLKKIFRR